jgi:hypothetical protein
VLAKHKVDGSKPFTRSSDADEDPILETLPPSILRPPLMPFGKTTDVLERGQRASL